MIFCHHGALVSCSPCRTPATDWPSSNLCVSLWTLGMGGCERDRIQEKGDSRDGVGEGGSFSKGERRVEGPVCSGQPLPGVRQVRVGRVLALLAVLSAD